MMGQLVDRGVRVSSFEHENRRLSLWWLFRPDGPWQCYRYPTSTMVVPLDMRVRLTQSPPPPPDAWATTRPPEFIGDQVTFTSVGLDIGSSTTHLTFARLVMRRPGGLPGSRYVVVRRDIIYESQVILTPFRDARTIDTQVLSDFVSRAYREAQLTVDDIHTGASIVTGEAATKGNAAAISALFAEQAGAFVSATAGPDLEAMLAAHGSGAVARSVRRAGVSHTVLNVDIGGGTTKLAICCDGQVVDTAAIHAGARLVAFDAEGRVTRIEAAGQLVADALGIPLGQGASLSPANQADLAERLATCLVTVAARQPLDPLAARLMITAPLRYPDPIDELIFSGGVTDYLYGDPPGDHGDLGRQLGRAVRVLADRLDIPIGEPVQRIRATVIGAALDTLQLSSSTIYVSTPSLLPRRNLRVIAPAQPPGSLTVDGVRGAIEQALGRWDLTEGEEAVAIGIAWSFTPCYQELKVLAEGIVAALPKTIARRRPVIVILEEDLGHSLGCLLAQEIIPGHNVIALDEVKLGELDFVDLGEVIPQARAIPVVVKSLVFAAPHQRNPGVT
jgi:ethanolamine utilization protein EutA